MPTISAWNVVYKSTVANMAVVRISEAGSQDSKVDIEMCTNVKVMHKYIIKV